MPAWLDKLNREIVACTRCPRLVEYRQKIAREKRRAYLDWEYWGKPVPGFGDPEARVLILGLAPGAHGSNRTGRPFTGDGSGYFMYPVLHRTGFASQASATHRGDGLELRDAYITAVVRCAPPANKPTPGEIANCAPFLDHEFVEFVIGLPSSLKLRGHTSKYILKKAMKSFLPHDVIHRKKKGFGVPIAKWVKGPLKELFGDLLSPERIEREGFLNPAYVGTLLADHLAGKKDNRKQLWTLLVWELWVQQYHASL